ncbi:MAG: ABC transporter ATP-binding protein [Anaerolineaceae bacterium]|nr:ABC transporter ATP-binding protein [Anaerolineaceae bacterium]
MTENIIQTQHLTRRFGSVVAVSDLDLAVPKGCVYGFLGPNGAGKTTTIRMLLGLIHPNQGSIQIFGSDLKKNRLRTLENVGSLAAAPSLYPNLTGRENLLVFSKLLGVPKTDIERVLEIVQMQPAANRMVRHYSTGMRQRLGLATALLNHPTLLILDEPTNGLDPAGILEMRQLLRGLPEAFGVTVFLSTHLLNEVEQIATQIGIINNGKLIFQGSPEHLQNELSGNAILEVDNLDRARHILTGMGWKVSQNGDHTLSIVSQNDHALAQANAQLVSQGIEVYHLSQEKRSLEEIFLSLTSTEKED